MIVKPFSADIIFCPLCFLMQNLRRASLFISRQHNIYANIPFFLIGNRIQLCVFLFCSILSNPSSYYFTLQNVVATRMDLYPPCAIKRPVSVAASRMFRASSVTSVRQAFIHWRPPVCHATAMRRAVKMRSATTRRVVVNASQV